MLSVGPNPSAEALWVRFAVPVPSRVRAIAVDLLGRTVAELWNGEAAGEQTILLDVTRWAPGVYVIRLETPTHAQSVVFTVAR